MALKLSRNSRIVIFFTFLNMVFAGVLVLVLVLIMQTNKEAASLNASIDEKIGNRDQMNVLEKYLNDTYVLQRDLNEYFVHENELAKVFKQFEDIGDLAGVSLELKNVIVDGKEDPFVRLGFDALGTWSQLYHFMSLVETLPYAGYLTKAFIEVRSTPATESQIEGETEEGALPVDPQWSGSFEYHLRSFIKAKEV